MFGKFLYRIIEREAAKKNRILNRKAEVMADAAMDRQPCPSMSDFLELQGKFDMLCNHLKVRIIRPYGYQVVDTSKEVGPERPAGGQTLRR